MNNTPILLTDRITRTRYKRVSTHWSERPWASWGLAGLILASLVVFGVLGCDRGSTFVDTVNASFAAGVHMGKLCDAKPYKDISVCCDDKTAKLYQCADAVHAN